MHYTNHSDTQVRPYRGRFAPSPTGKLHLGSLTTALASCLQARQNCGEWLVRIEDIDPLREVPGATSSILKTLEAHGFTWDGPIVYQKTRLNAYREALDQLLKHKLAYPCSCSRRDMKPHRDGHLYYPGNCRNNPAQGQLSTSIRIRTHNEAIFFNDALQGRYEQRIESTTGDFVIRRKDGFYAYQLAVVVDDAWQGITEVVRGSDLIESTPRQLHLYDCLNLNPPNFGHIPVIRGPEGAKLSKSIRSPALNPRTPSENLWLALNLLQQAPPDALRNASLQTIWEWAKSNWTLTTLKTVTSSCL